MPTSGVTNPRRGSSVFSAPIVDRRRSFSTPARIVPSATPAMFQRRRSRACCASCRARDMVASAYPARTSEAKIRSASPKSMRASSPLQVVEDRGVDLVARGFHPLPEARPDARGGEASDDLAVLDALALEGEQLLEHDGVAFHAGDLGYARHPACPVGQARGLHDDVESLTDLLAHGARRQLEAGHLDHGLQPI